MLYAEGRDGPANRNRLCVKGRFGVDYVHHPDRLTVPLIRKENVAKDAGDRVDPADPSSHFRAATWEEALDRAAAGLKRIRDRDGRRALAAFGSAKGSNEEAYLVQKLVRVGFGCNNVDHCTRLCHASSVAALLEGIGSAAVTAPFTAALDSDVIIAIGARPTENHPVAATFIKNAKKEGKTLIVIDPRGQGLSRHADFNLQFKPGTDVALLNAIMHTIVEEGLTNAEYIQTYTEGYAELKARIEAFSPDRMADVCGVDAEAIRAVARAYAKAERAIIFWGMGISQHVHGTDNARCLIALAMLTGHVGRPGTGLHPLRGQNNVQGASDVGLIPMVYPDYQSVEDDEIRERFEEFWGVELDPKRGLTVVEIMNAAHAGEIKGMYIMGENPAMSDPDTNHVREALARMEHLVVQDIFLTETAFHADVILPATTLLEKTGTFTNTNREVQIARPVLEPPGDARQGLVDHPGDRPPHRPRLDLHPPLRRVRRNAPGHGIDQGNHLGATGTRGRRHLPLRVRGRARPGNHLRGWLSDAERPRQVRAGEPVATRRAARRDLSPGAVDGDHAGALAHRRDHPPCGRARRHRTRRHRVAESKAVGAPGRRAGGGAYG